MLLLVLGLVVFVGFHLLPSLGGARPTLVARFGEPAYMALFSVGSLIGLALLIAGYATAADVPVYAPPAWGRHLARAVMLAACLLLVAAFVPNSLKGRVRHPMLWGVALWGLAHLLANGGAADVLLFGGLGAWSLAGIWLINRRKHPPFGPPQPLVWNLVALALGVALYGALFWAHPWLFGVAPG